jgi:hypothetical protein
LNGAAQNESARGAARLASFLVSHQKNDGHWTRTWNPVTGAQLADDRWVGDQAWCVMALMTYAAKSNDTGAKAAAQKGAAWLKARIAADGSVVPSTEGTAQYVCAGGQDAAQFLQVLLALQREDGGMPNSTGDWGTTCFGWLSAWTGLAPTCWLYFALTHSPFQDVTETCSGVDSNQSTMNFVLTQNFPNPFNNGTTISYQLSTPSRVTMDIISLRGERVITLVSEFQEAGSHTVKWNGLDQQGLQSASGLYIYSIQMNELFESRKMILLR